MSSAHQCLVEVVEALLANTKNIVKMPSDETERRRLADEFYTYHFPNVIVAIDGTMITVHVPSINRTDYFTRKHTTALNLTVCCDANKRFLNINVGQSARCHDSHIFQHSQLFTTLHNGQVPTQYHVIGDAAYGLSTSVMVPYPGANLSLTQESYNNRHLSTRMVVERSFSDLKRRWLRLLCLRSDIEFATKLIAACCCLHNISIDFGDIKATRRDHRDDGVGNIYLRFNSPAEKRDAINEHLAVQ